MDPRPLTLRQLCLLAEGAQRERWARTGALMALLANCHRDPAKCRPFKPSDFDPYGKRGGGRIQLSKGTIGLLREEMGV